MNGSRAIALVLLSAGVLASTTGCMQLGEYAMGGDCDGFAGRSVDVVQDVLGVDSEIDDRWAGEADVWCSFTMVPGTAGIPSESEKTQVREGIAEVVDSVVAGVEITVSYADGTDDVIRSE